MQFNWQKHFPHKSPRKEQIEAIEFTLDAFINQGKQIVMLDAPTGCGKSAVAITVARYLEENVLNDPGFDPGSYVLTTQKTLQDQYMNDFGDRMKNIKSSSNYDCKFFKGQSCGEASRIAKYEKKGSKLFNTCIINCSYKKAKQAFIEGNEGVTNFSYFLAETGYAGKIKPRKLLVIDECHNTRGEISSFIEITLSGKFSKNILRLDMPENVTQTQAFKWIKNEYQLSLTKHVIHVKGIIDKLKKVSNPKLDVHAKQFEMLDKHLCKVNRFLTLYDKDNWVLNEIEPQGKSGRKFEFKPVDVAPFIQHTLLRFGRYTLMMSATILDKQAMCSMLGLDETLVNYLKIQSPFPIKNRPVLIADIGSMARSSINETLPKLAQTIKMILEEHKDEKGVIHVNSYQISKHIQSTIKDKRLIFHGSHDRERALQKHISSNKPTVLISPSMTEGIDLKDDLSRFCIICKVPWPYLGDKICRKLMKKHKWWYGYETSKTIVQSIGRSIRNDQDHAVTYILDSDFKRLYANNREYFPEEFDEMIA